MSLEKLENRTEELEINKAQKISEIEDLLRQNDLCSSLYSENYNFDDLNDSVHIYISEQDVIYYHKAMEYLNENDSSLNKSLDIASELGYDVLSLNSEILATLLYQEELRTKWYEISEEIEGLIDEIEEISEEITNL